MATDEEQAFLNAIFASPTDGELKLVYADWLDERGDVRGQFLRLQCRLAGMATDEPEYLTLHPRLSELRGRCPDNWVASLEGPIWCVAANVIQERPYGPGGTEVRRGTKHFAAGAKVYVFHFYWGMGGENVTVVGRHRKSQRYITLAMLSVHLTNWRAELAYSPAVLRVVSSRGEFFAFPRGGEVSKRRAEEIAELFNSRESSRRPGMNEGTDAPIN